MSLKTFVPVLLLPLLATAAELPALRTEPIGGGSVFFVKNTSSQPLTAYLIELVGYPGSTYLLWKDEILEEPIAPGAEKRIQVANMTAGAVPDYMKISAAIYADGSTAGVPEKISQFIDRRRILMLTTNQLIGHLGKPQDKPVAIGDLKQMANSFQPPEKAKANSQLAINQAAARGLVNDTIAFLEGHSREETLAHVHECLKKLTVSKPGL